MKLGILHVLTLVFLILKLTETITWSWFFVLLPSIIGFLPVFFIFFVFIIFMVFGIIYPYFKTNRKYKSFLK